MRTHISRSFEHAEALRGLNYRLREFARQTIGEVPQPDKPSPGDAYPSGLPMNEELRIAISASDQPIQDLNEAMNWLEQMFGTEVAGPTNAPMSRGDRGTPSASKY